MTTANYEGFAFKLSGLTTGPGSTIPLGTTLEKVVLTTRDLLTNTTPDGVIVDSRGLSTGESANILVNGVLLTTTVPSFRAVQLITNAGSFTALVFTIGADSFALPLRGADFDATTVTAASVVNTPAALTIDPLSYDLLPEGASTFTAQTFSTQEFGGPAGGLPDYSEITTTTLYDTDVIRGNGEIVRQIYTESLATLQFSDGTILGGVETLQTGGYSGYVSFQSYLFDAAALAASGHTIADVAAVLGSFAFDHDLTWTEAGFSLIAGPITDGGGDDVPPPPPPPPPPNQINGTSRADVIVGTSGRDAIRGFDGSDTMTGRGGDDAFIFGTDSRSGKKSVDVIKDYDVGHDLIGLEGGASIRNIVDNGSAIVITLVGDGDRIVINGAELTVDDITVVSTSGSLVLF